MAFGSKFRSSKVSTRSLLKSTSNQLLLTPTLHRHSRVPDHTPVLDADLVKALVDLVHLGDTFIQTLLRPEDGDIALHSLLHIQPNLRCRQFTAGVSDPVQVGDGLLAQRVVECAVRCTRGVVVPDVIGTRSTKDDNVEERVGAETVSTVDGDTGSFTGGVETGHDLVVAVLVDGQDFTGVLGRDTTHVVVYGRQDGDRLLGNVDTGKDGGRLGDTGQSFVQDFGGQVRELQVDVILFGTDTSTFPDFQRHGSGNDVSRSQILGGRCVSLHETFTLAVEQVTTFTSGTLGDQTTGTVDTRRVELNKLQILQRQPGTRDHGVSVTGTCVGGSTRKVGTAVTTGRQDGVVRSESMERSVFHVERDHTDTLAILHEQVERKVFDEEVGVVSEGLTVKGVQDGVTCSIGSGGTSVGLSTLAILEGLTTERSLVDLSFLGSGEGNTVVLELTRAISIRPFPYSPHRAHLDNRIRRLLAHVMNRILVTQPITTLDGVVHVPPPIILGHVSQSGIDTTLGGDGVRTCGEKLGDACCLETGFSETEGCSETGTTGTAGDEVV